MDWPGFGFATPWFCCPARVAPSFVCLFIWRLSPRMVSAALAPRH